jgi:hypothetical protein
MNADELIEKYGPPDIELSILRLWVHERQVPDAQDFWDGNWVNATVHCGAQGANVWVEGPILHLSELQRWLEDCERMYVTLSGTVELKCMEPYLYVRMSMTKTGRIDAKVSVTADHLWQTHEFEFSIDQSYLPGMAQGCREVLGRVPLREVS